jgi:hypothetical protein
VLLPLEQLGAEVVAGAKAKEWAEAMARLLGENWHGETEG